MAGDIVVQGTSDPLRDKKASEEDPTSMQRDRWSPTGPVVCGDNGILDHGDSSLEVQVASASTSSEESGLETSGAHWQ